MRRNNAKDMVKVPTETLLRLGIKYKDLPEYFRIIANK